MGGLYGKLFKKPEVRVLFQGLDGAGKTTMLYQLKLGEVVITIPTIGFNVETIEYKNISIIAWDVGGANKIRALYRHYYQNTGALVYVVDSTDEGERMEETKEEIHRAMGDDDLKECVLLVLANKQDLAGAYSHTKISEILELHKLDPRRVWNIFPASAKMGDGLFEAFEWLIAQFGAKQPITDNMQSAEKPIDYGSKDRTSQATLYTRIWSRLSHIFYG